MAAAARKQAPPAAAETTETTVEHSGEVKPAAAVEGDQPGVEMFDEGEEEDQVEEDHEEWSRRKIEDHDGINWSKLDQ